MHLCQSKNDPLIHYWGDMYQQEMEVNKKRLVGIFLPVWNCLELAKGAYHSLLNSMPKNYPFAFMAIDGGSTDGTWEFFKGTAPVFGNNDPTFPYDVRGYDNKDCTPNVAVELFLGKYDKEKDRFENEDRINYFCWIHSDMDFVQPGWLDTLVDIYESDPKIGFLSPVTHYEDGRTKPYPQNASPLLVSVEHLKRMYKAYGYLTDPKFAWIVAHDDWDMHFRSIELGYKTLMAPEVIVIHKGMGTRENIARKDAGWREAEEFNKNYYYEKWKTWMSPFPNTNCSVEDNFVMPSGKVLRFSEQQYEGNRYENN